MPWVDLSTLKIKPYFDPIDSKAIISGARTAPPRRYLFGQVQADRPDKGFSSVPNAQVKQQRQET
uniref:Uncharacterized protein n=1 Tax=Uncultured archaeon GZfos26G2 TaxID=3386331 RepID=Q64BT0_UNCAG|nr:hypothetical protein GZ26G2_16 [uncultured archaeon GZfos26G2]